jgi:serine/threonine protein kinase
MSSEPDPMQAAPSGEATRTISTGEATPGSFIGPYKIIREIGEGGMGIVFHAQQTYPIRRDLALKIIKPGMDSRQVIARFESERQAPAGDRRIWRRILLEAR